MKIWLKMKTSDTKQTRKSVLNLYIKLFLIYGFLFGLLMTAWEYYDTKHINIWKQIFQGISFGAVMSWINVMAQRRAWSIKEKDNFQ